MITYSTYLGGGNNPPNGPFSSTGFADSGTAIAVDAAGNAYVTGKTDSADFPLVRPSYLAGNPNQSGIPGCFVSKLDPAGTKLIYSTFFYGVCTIKGHQLLDKYKNENIN